MSRSTLSLLLAIGLTACQEPNEPQPVAASQAIGTNTSVSISAAAIQPAAASVDIAKALDASVCNIESVAGRPFAASALLAEVNERVRGWLGHVQGGSPIEQPVLAFLDDHGQVAAVLPLTLDQDREDVAKMHGGREDLRHAGFEVGIPPLASGHYRLILHYHVAGRAFRCDNGRQLVVG